MTIKEKIEQEISSHYGQIDSISVREGANIALKAVIEMLEDRLHEHGKTKYVREYLECGEIINLLKSEA